MAEGVRSSHLPASPASEGALTMRTQNPPAVERARDQTPGPSEEAKSAAKLPLIGADLSTLCSRGFSPQGECVTALETAVQAVSRLSARRHLAVERPRPRW